MPRFKEEPIDDFLVKIVKGETYRRLIAADVIMVLADKAADQYIQVKDRFHKF